MVEVEVYATPVAAQADAQSPGPAGDSLPPEEYAGDAEEEEDGRCDGVDLLAVRGAQEKEDVEVVDDVDPGGWLEMENGSGGVGDDVEF